MNPYNKFYTLIFRGLFVLMVIASMTVLPGQGAYALNAQGDISIFLNEEELSFSVEPIVRQGVIFVPVSEIASALGMYYRSYGYQNVILYKNNLFIKFNNETDIAYLNGKSIYLSGVVFEEQNRMFVPLDFFTKALDYDAAWDTSTGRYTLNSGSSDYKFAFFKDSFYKKIFIDEFGINFSVPIHWDRLATDRQSYGFMDNNELFSVRISTNALSQSTSLEDYRNAVNKSILSGLVGLSGPPVVNTTTSTRIDSHALEYSVRQGPQRFYYITYVFLQDHVGYQMDFVFNDYIEPSNASAIIRNIAESFQVNKLTIRESEEHYIEYTNFFTLGVQLEQEIYSNQIVFNTQQFEGTLTNPDDTDQLLITVSKDTNRLEFAVPVIEGHFEAKIYLPFGLGKHNILVERIEKGNFIFRTRRDNNFEPSINYNRDNVLQFSLINTSGDKIRYLVPTFRIPSDNAQILSVANLLTFKEVIQFSKAQSLYVWILTHIGYDYESGEYSRSALDVFNEELGTEEEISFLYAAFLRSIGIPARISTGDIFERTHLWVEIYINGEWRVADIGHEITSYVAGHTRLNYFWLDRTDFYKNYQNIKTLNE